MQISVLSCVRCRSTCLRCRETICVRSPTAQIPYNQSEFVQILCHNAIWQIPAPAQTSVFLIVMVFEMTLVIGDTLCYLQKQEHILALGDDPS